MPTKGIVFREDVSIQTENGKLSINETIRGLMKEVAMLKENAIEAILLGEEPKDNSVYKLSPEEYLQLETKL